MLSIVPDIMSDPLKLNSQFNLNNIDVDQIIQVLIEYRNTALKLAAMIVSLVVMGMMLNEHHIKEQVLRAQMSKVQQKLDVIASRQEAIKNLDDFKTSFPKGINEDKIITQITAFAPSQDVTINSLSPRESQDMGLYDVVEVSLTGAARDYKAMVLFLRAMEKSKYLFRVDSWMGGSNEGTGEVNFTMVISALHIHT